MKICPLLPSFLIYFFLLPSSAFAIEDPSVIPEQVTTSEQFDQQIDLTLPLIDEHGSVVALQEFILPDRPLIITPVYYGCPRLCGLVLDGFTEVLRQTDLELGRDFTVATVSFDHTEQPAMAATAAHKYRSALPSLPNARAWGFFTGREASVKPLMQQLGFRYVEDSGEFSHVAVFMILTPKGRISRYFYGINFSPQDLRFALVEASRGRIGSPLDHVLLFCFRFDPSQGRYTLAVMRLTQAVCMAVVIALGSGIIWLRIRELRALRTVRNV